MKTQTERMGREGKPTRFEKNIDLYIEETTQEVCDLLVDNWIDFITNILVK